MPACLRRLRQRPWIGRPTQQQESCCWIIHVCVSVRELTQDSVNALAWGDVCAAEWAGPHNAIWLRGFYHPVKLSLCYVQASNFTKKTGYIAEQTSLDYVDSKYCSIILVVFIVSTPMTFCNEKCSSNPSNSCGYVGIEPSPPRTEAPSLGRW